MENACFMTVDLPDPPKAVIHIEPVGDSFKIVCSIVGYPIPSRYSLTIQGRPMMSDYPAYET